MSHFPVFVLASLLLFTGILRFVLKKRGEPAPWKQFVNLSLIVVVVGMLFGRYGAQAGFPWWIYYPVPALLTLVLPPLVLKLTQRELLIYLVLAALMAPVIHLVFSFFLGWKEYMPFFIVPSIWDLVRS